MIEILEVVLRYLWFTFDDSAAYGTILVQGWGQFGKHQVETPALIRLLGKSMIDVGLSSKSQRDRCV